MKMKILIFCLVLFNFVGSAQTHPWEVKFSHQIEKDLADEVISASKAAFLYSLIGRYHNSISYSDIPVSWGVDSLDLIEYSTEKALPNIIEAAKDHQIVIISENHRKPQHRILAKQIIEGLAKHGYKHLGLETFSSQSNNNTLLDVDLTDRGYPLDSPLTGTYTLEPKMGELVRTAIDLNYNLFAYERSAKIKGKDRDEIQADNIIKYLKSNPKSKIIIVCGFYHAIESNFIKRGTSYYMAKYLKEKLEIDPLTIYQDNFTEKFIENEHPILKTKKISEPSVFVDESGVLVKISNNVDFEIIHPKTIYINGRPNWLYETDQYKPVEIKLENIEVNFPVIVSAFPFEEINSVPVDRIELKHKDDHKVLVLKNGKYRITINDGESTIDYNQTIK